MPSAIFVYYVGEKADVSKTWHVIPKQCGWIQSTINKNFRGVLSF